MRSSFAALLLASAVPAFAALPPAAAPVGALVAQVRIPYEQFTLPNGLRVIVHTDRKAPVVAVSVWYHVGSGSEPAGKTGYAHLYEHLMFNGSENAPGDFFEPLQQVGATDYNGTTSFDRTNYFETVPTNALDRALWLESDRMGHMLGAITQANLDNQIGVVQNEKRQGDNQPYGLFKYKLSALFPADHPYGHTTIGSMADLSRASLDDVKGWFRDNYGPNNAVLVLAGDIDLATAKAKVTRYFGDVPRGPQTKLPPVPVAPLAQPKAETIHDRVAATRLYRLWPIPNMTDRDAPLLEVASGVLGGLASSRLDTILVRQEKLAVSTSANASALERGGYFLVTADVRPGVDPALVSQRIDAIVADFLRTGPSADEVRRVATVTVAGRIRGLEQVGGFVGKATALAQGALYANDPDFYAKQLQAIATASPAAVKAAADRWLSKPAFSLTVAPGAREAYQEATPAKTKAAAAIAAAEDAARPIGRGGLPTVGDPLPLRFPAIERTTLANGIRIIYARRTTVPVTRLAMSFDAGNAADPRSALGTQSMMMALLDEGTKTRSSQQIAEEEERLGATIGGGPSMDRTTVDLTALSANLAPSLDLFADIVRNPAFAPAEVDRLRNQQLAGIAQEMTNPAGLAARVMPPALFGAGHPYDAPFSGSGDPAVVKTLTPAQLAAFHAAWIRPDTATLFVVSDRSLTEVKPLLDARFGAWTATGPKGAKAFGVTPPQARSRILLVDRPQSPQSFILAGELLPYRGTDKGLEAVGLANDALAGTFLSRVNMDLRESKGWSYGVSGAARLMVDQVPYLLSAPVQADKTGPSIAAARADMRDFLTTKGITAAERTRAINNRVRSLPGSFETSAALLGAMQSIDTYRRPDDYYVRLPDLYRSLDVAALDAALRKALDPDRLVWVVVGDAGVVKPQLDALGLPVETVANPIAQVKP